MDKNNNSINTDYNKTLNTLKEILSKISNPNSLKDLKKFKQDIHNLIKEQTSIPLNIKVIENGITCYDSNGNTTTSLIYYSLPSDKEETSLFLIASFVYRLDDNIYLKDFGWKYYPLCI